MLKTQKLCQRLLILYKPPSLQNNHEVQLPGTQLSWDCAPLSSLWWQIAATGSFQHEKQAKTNYFCSTRNLFSPLFNSEQRQVGLWKIYLLSTFSPRDVWMKRNSLVANKFAFLILNINRLRGGSRSKAVGMSQGCILRLQCPTASNLGDWHPGSYWDLSPLMEGFALYIHVDIITISIFHPRYLSSFSGLCCRGCCDPKVWQLQETPSYKLLGSESVV